MNQFLMILATTLLMVGCATTGAVKMPFPAEGKTPSVASETLRVHLGPTIQLVAIDGKDVAAQTFGTFLVLPPGKHSLTIASKIWTAGTTVEASKTRDSRVELSVDGKAGEAFWVGVDRDYEDIIGLKQTVAINTAPGTELPVQQFVVTPAQQVTAVLRKTTDASMIYTSPMAPLWPAGVRLFVYASGGTLHLFDPNPDLSKQTQDVNVAGTDLIGAWDGRDGKLWLLDKSGKSYWVTLAGRKVEPAPIQVTKPQKFQAGASVVAVQVSDTAIVKVVPRDGTVKPWVTAPALIRRWSLASDSGDVLVQTDDELAIYDAQGAVVVSRRINRLLVGMKPPTFLSAILGEAGLKSLAKMNEQELTDVRARAWKTYRGGWTDTMLASLSDVALSPDGRRLAFRSRDLVFFLYRADWQGFADGLSWVLGDPGVENWAGQKLLWGDNGHLYAMRGDKSMAGGFYARVYAVPPEGSELRIVSDRLTGEVLNLTANGITTDLVDATVSADGMKLGFLGANGPLGVPLFYAAAGVDFTAPDRKPKTDQGRR